MSQWQSQRTTFCWIIRLKTRGIDRREGDLFINPEMRTTLIWSHSHLLLKLHNSRDLFNLNTSHDSLVLNALAGDGCSPSKVAGGLEVGLVPLAQHFTPFSHIYFKLSINVSQFQSFVHSTTLGKTTDDLVMVSHQPRRLSTC